MSSMNGFAGMLDVTGRILPMLSSTLIASTIRRSASHSGSPFEARQRESRRSVMWR
jgi:hypothetical protein